MNNNELRSLIVNDLKELLLLFDGMSEMAEIPLSVLNLASVKVEHISDRIKELSPLNTVGVTSQIEEVEPDTFQSELVEDEEDEMQIMDSEDVFLDEDEECEELDEEYDELDEEEEWEDDDNEGYEDESDDWDEDENDANDENLRVETDDEFGTDFVNGIVEKASEDASKFATKDKTDIATKVVSKRLESRFVVSLKKMGIVDRYRYSKELFGGDMGLLTQTIDVLDGMASLDEAISYIHSHFSWDEQNAAVADFLVLLENRFS
ncbi:MAG: hypothetical protein J6R59_06600 [Paludibacteraceae bacterium]|nr:hypothetical protein [Paludibacteraceae bacterium]